MRFQGIDFIVSSQIVPYTAPTFYRNKCEFTIGKDLEGKVRNRWRSLDYGTSLQTCVGFVGGRFAKGEHYVLPVDGCPNLSPQTLAIVRAFATFVEESGEFLSRKCGTESPGFALEKSWMAGEQSV